ncbi:MAG TPA: MBL fold metallo-hydrolase, partial [Dehalococcoidia bacterium]|nr:MBL fold metallo-hydrolase [Dehalococcoidia bacterium]
MQTHSDGPLTITKFDSLGAYGNNAYLVADREAREAAIVDMPAGSRAVLDALGDLKVTAIVLTHTHPDHWADYDLVKNATGAPVFCHPAEVIMPAARIDRPLADGDDIPVGEASLRAMHTPGHTPGSICYLTGRILFSGDVLFPGGPGRTQSPADLRRSIESITTRLHPLPDDTLVLPGHGGDTTIADSKR